MEGLTSEEEKDLRDPDNWEDEGAQEPQPDRPARAIVSVAFSRDDFERVADFAESNGMKISEVIRNAALERVANQAPTVYWPATLVDTDARWSIVPDPDQALQTVPGTAVPA